MPCILKGFPISNGMNIHPAFVHFPIALLTLYCVCEILWFARLRNNISWWWFKFGLLFFGTLASYATYQTGKLAASMATEISPLLIKHATFATYSVRLFTFLLIMYLVQGISRGTIFPTLAGFFHRHSVTRTIWKILTFLERIVLQKYVVILFAILGLTFITITGGLGGAMVYGPDADPAVSLIYHFFF